MIPTWDEFNEGKHFTTTKGNNMAELEYNKEAVDNDKPKFPARVPGIWTFVVKDAKLIKANSGNQGINVELVVDQDGTDQRCYDTFWLSDNALFRLKSASVACGSKMPDEDYELIGWTGKARFAIDEKDDKGYFKVVEYINPSQSAPKVEKEGENFKGATASDW